MDKDAPAQVQHYNAAIRWVGLTVTHAMVFRGDPLDKDLRRTTVMDILGRWRGNRGTTWTPSIADLDRLYEATIKWAVENTNARLFE
ncbi:MAG: hypothetical protein AABZ53_07125 [Planctomycetota bacterium]